MLLVIADESIRATDARAFRYLQVVGVEYGVVALTKSDLADEGALAVVQLEIEEYLRGSLSEGGADCASQRKNWG